MINFRQKGNFSKTENFLNSTTKINYLKILEKYGQEGVNTLASSTPTDSGLTASSWSYEIKEHNGSYTITWKNSNIVDGTPVAILIQYGHAKKSGGFVQGRDYINPALKPIFDKLADEAWKEVNKL